MKNISKNHLDKAFQMTGLESKSRCETLDSVLGVVVKALFKKGRNLSDYGQELFAFGEDCRDSAWSYIEFPS